MRLLWLGTLCLAVVQCESDYYKLLGVEKDADDRTIRKAFKKLAIKMHPDKNTGNPNAHAEFVEINKAYEVLKDEELRKKYDQYGEKGLEDGFQGGNNYQSWQFYNDNFGIYDEDAEIVTLNRADFQRLVTDSPNEMWFINFYSTYCSHCHQLAPTWRKFAREMEGTVRIGAVNCAEDPMLCQSQRVNAYPSLVLYPTGEFYQGHREVEHLTDFVMQRMKSEVLHLNSENIESLSMDWEPYNERPWLVDFCDEAETCLSPANRRKLAAMLDGLVNVGSVDCTRNAEAALCERLGRTEGVAFFPAKAIVEGEAKELASLDPKDITEKVIAFLDHLEEIEYTELEQLFGENGAQWATAVWFVPDQNSLDQFNDYRRIPALLPDMRILYADCSKFKEVCEQHLDVKKLPQFVVFKPTGGYEIDYVNKGGFREAVAFIRESALSPLHALNEHTYSEAIHSGNLWIVDYFAPWCPPCLRLMAEYRRFHSTIDNSADEVVAKVNIGSIDCQKYGKICQEAGVQSYPTSILYTEDGKQHRMVGFHGVQAVADFIDNALNPAVDELTPEDFEELVANREEDVTWVVDFFAPWCGPCQQLAPELQKAARSLKANDEKVKVGSVDCQAHAEFCRKLQVQAYPLVRLYPAKKQKIKRAQFYEYPQNMWRNADSIERWVFGMLPSLVTPLGNDFWTTVLDSDEPWLVDFYAPWCGHCVQFAPVYEQIAKIVDGKVKLAKVDCDQWPGVCQGAQIHAYPSVRLYKGRPDGSSRQDIWGVQIQSQQKEAVLNMVRKQLPSLFHHDEL